MGGELAAQERDVEVDPTVTVELDTVRVGSRADDLIGIATSASEGRVGAVDLLARPIAREGELLESVPGMIVTQHSGEGKANQFFVRGFNLDHGTDFQTRVEGMPVNQPTHGHGQGYTDLNFLIPEFVDLLNYRLGVHHAEIGDFGSAGGAEIHLARSLESPLATLTVGENGYTRAVAGSSLRLGGGDFLLGGEGRLYDGPWELSQDLRKLNGLARYSWSAGDSRFSVLGLAYGARWNATDQIPRRLVEDGTIGRFGHVDPSDGGDSRRFSLSGSWGRLRDRSSQEVQLFAIFSDLDLYSNFTYSLEDEDRGDQFRQQDRRYVLGGNVKHTQALSLFGAPHTIAAGIQHRTDLITDVGLSLTEARDPYAGVRRDEVTETATGVFIEASSRWRPWLRTTLGVRGDGYTFNVESDRAENSGDADAAIVSPKASIALAPHPDAEVYVSGGLGFHSNDARGTTITVDPVSGEPVESVDPLVRSRGGEVGIRLSPGSGLQSSLAGWLLELDSELLFVGDAGATEPVGASRRTGVTWANHYRSEAGLTLEVDLSFARARLSDAEEGEDRVPGAMERVVTGGLGWLPSAGLFGSLRLRHFGEYPLIEDNSMRADPATLLNAEFGYRLRNGLRLEIAVLNLLDSEASDIEYFYASRLPGEPADGVEDVHFHPVEPRQVRASLTWGLR